MAQATGIENVAFKGNLTAIVKQDAACAALFVILVNTGLHVSSLVPGLVQHGRGMPADADCQGVVQRLVVVHIGAKCGEVQIQPYAFAPVLACRVHSEPGMKALWGQRAEQHGSGTGRIWDLSLIHI